MKEYERQIVVELRGERFQAHLKIIRLPTSWYAVIWDSPERYSAISQDRTELNEGFAHMNDQEFLDQVHLVAGFRFGVNFEYVPVS